VIRIIALLSLFALPAQAGEQVRIYGPDGRSLGTVTKDSAGNERFRDVQGRSTGTSSTSGNTTTIYDQRGNVIGRAKKE
jgi:YD repeat-containing protein